MTELWKNNWRRRLDQVMGKKTVASSIT